MTVKPILLVEDSPDDADLTLMSLKETGLLNEVVVVEDGVEALDYLFATGRYAGRDPRKTPALVLLVEDSEDDYQLLLVLLREGGFAPSAQRAETAAELGEALRDTSWQIVISDYSLPGFNGLAALRMVRAVNPDMPFIVVSGAIDEGDAVAAMRAGAQDYLFKGKLARLIPAVRRELDNACSYQRLDKASKLAEAAARAKSEILATVSHEIRTPMNGIVGMASLLLNESLPAHQREYAETILASAEALLGIVNDVLAFSSLEAGKLEIQSGPIDLHTLVEDVAAVLASKAAEKDLELVVRYHPEAPRYFIGDAGRIRQILINLAGNAIRFTEHGSVRIEVTCQGDSQNGVLMRVAVEDTGIGVPHAQQHLLFRPFSQAHHPALRSLEGTGLGLSISKELVTLMGGVIGLESEESRGSTFWFLLPLRTRQAPEAAPPMPGKRVLLAGSRPQSLETLSERLIAWGLRTETAASHGEILPWLREAAGRGAPFHLLLVDDRPPAFDAEVLGRELRGHPYRFSARLLALTQSPSRGAILEAAGFDACLSNPPRERALRDAIHPAAEPLPSPEAMLARPEAGTAGWRILLAEDNPVNQKVASYILREMGCTVDVAPDGLQAVELWRTKPYHAIFMDCRMPKMDGYQAATAIRKAEITGKRIPIIALTANALDGDREACLAAGMDDYLTKPLLPENLGRALERWKGAAARSMTLGAGAPEVITFTTGNSEI